VLKDVTFNQRKYIYNTIINDYENIEAASKDSEIYGIKHIIVKKVDPANEKEEQKKRDEEYNTTIGFSRAWD